MVIQLQLSTVFLTTGFVSIALLLSMLVVTRQRTTYSGFGRWAWATFALAFGMALIGWRDRLPPFLTVIVANTSLLASLVLIHDGLIRFAGGNPKPAWYGVPFIALEVPYILLTYVTPNVRLRVMISSAIFVVYSGVILWYYAKRIASTYKRNWLLPVGFSVQMAIFLARIIHLAMLRRGLSDFMQSGNLEAFLIILIYSTSIVIIVGLVVLNYQRTELELRNATSEVKTLRGIIPICASCKKIRDDEGYWNAVDSYLRLHTEAEFSHGLCPDCSRKLYPELFPDDGGSAKSEDAG